MATRENDPAAERATKYKVLVASGVIGLCAVWLGYQLIPWGGGPPVIAPASPADRFLAEARKVHGEERFEYVIMVGSEDGATVDVSGKVASDSDLKDLRAKFDELAAATPGVTMRFNVAVGRLK